MDWKLWTGKVEIRHISHNTYKTGQMLRSLYNMNSLHTRWRFHVQLPNIQCCPLQRNNPVKKMSFLKTFVLNVLTSRIFSLWKEKQSPQKLCGSDRNDFTGRIKNGCGSSGSLNQNVYILLSRLACFLSKTKSQISTSSSRLSYLIIRHRLTKGSHAKDEKWPISSHQHIKWLVNWALRWCTYLSI